MKTHYSILLIILSFLFFSSHDAIAQEDTASKIYLIYTYDGAEFIGKIISKDAKEVLLETKDQVQVFIPLYEIEEIIEVKSSEFSASGVYIPEQVFATRYFITTNGFSLAKGESYIIWNLYGPDFQFGISENFSLGIMTSWSGMPIIGAAKYSVKLNEKTSLGLGTLLGTGSWAVPDFGLALPFAALTYGDKRNNINFSAGYGAIWFGGDSNGSFLFSVGGIAKAGKKVSLVFDSFVVTNLGDGNKGMAILIPGIRIQKEREKAFQIGFGGLVVEGELMPSPMPMIQWFRKF